MLESIWFGSSCRQETRGRHVTEKRRRRECQVVETVIGEIPSKRLSKSNKNFLDDMHRLLKIGRNDSIHNDKCSCA